MPIALRHLARIRGRGYLPDKPDRRDHVFGAAGMLGGPNARTVLPVRVDLQVPWLLDQGGTSSCVAHAVAHAIGARELLRLGASAVPSRLWLYYMSRREHDGQRHDAGTYLRTACSALKRLGCPDEAEWPWKPVTKLHTQPGLEAVAGAAGRRGGAYSRITDAGPDRTRALKMALAQGLPVCFGVELADSFLDWTGPAVIDAPSALDPRVGGHAMTVIGYRTTATGTEFRIVNSWGPRWRDGGCSWVTEAFMWGARDLWAIDTFRRPA